MKNKSVRKMFIDCFKENTSTTGITFQPKFIDQALTKLAELVETQPIVSIAISRKTNPDTAYKMGCERTKSDIASLFRGGKE